MGEDAWLRLEAHGEAAVAVAPESALRELEAEHLRGPLRATEALFAEDLARMEAARLHDDGERVTLLQPVPLDGSLPPGLEAGAGPGLVMLRVPFTLRNTVIVEARELLAHELDPLPTVGLGLVDLAALWLPTADPEVWYVASAWALDVETLLSSRLAGWPSRMAQVGPGGVTVVSDGVPVIEQTPTPRVELSEGDLMAPPPPPPTSVAPSPERFVLVMPSGRRLELTSTAATLGRASDEHGFRTGPDLPVARIAPLRVRGRTALDGGVCVSLT